MKTLKPWLYIAAAGALLAGAPAFAQNAPSQDNSSQSMQNGQSMGSSSSSADSTTVQTSKGP